MLFNTLFGCIIFLTTNLSLLYTAHLFVKKYLPNTSPSVRYAAIGILYYSLIVLIFQALSPFQAISRTWVTTACLLLALVSHLLWGKQRNIQADIEPLKTWIRVGLNSRWAVLLIICGFAVLLAFSRALLMPPLAWDCLTYHLTFASLWIKKGALLLFEAPDQMSYNALFPINGEIFAAWLLLPFHNDLLVNTMNFPLTLLGGISCYAIARELGLTRKEASFAPALICFSPMIYSQITTEYTDIATFAFYSTAVLFALRYLQRGYLYDGLLTLVAAGTLLGTKYTGIPAVGLIFIAITIKTISLVNYSGFFKKFGLILLGLLIVGTFGGRQYIINTIEAGNPLYPFSFKIFNYEFEGSYYLEHLKEWVSEDEEKHGWDKYNLWNKEYRKFCYKPFQWWNTGHRKSPFPPLTAGPKFLLFLVLAFSSLFNRPRGISKGAWCFLGTMWIVSIGLFYIKTSADFARSATWTDTSFRFLAPFIALFTIQGLVVIQKIRKYFKKIDFFLVALIFWDLLYINKTHIWEIELFYPFLVLTVPLVLLAFKFVRKGKVFLVSFKLSESSNPINKRRLTYAFSFFVLVIGLYFLQSYRDNTRYQYYRQHFDLHYVTKAFVNGWEFLDRHDEKKTIAMTVDWEPPGDQWFFYPLLGSRLQNDIVYISAKYKREVPTWVHRGLLRGNDSSIWLHNLKNQNVDYIFVQKPWPIEISWILDYKEKFQLVFVDNNCKIFKYIGKNT